MWTARQSGGPHPQAVRSVTGAALAEPSCSLQQGEAAGPALQRVRVGVLDEMSQRRLRGVMRGERGLCKQARLLAPH